VTLDNVRPARLTLHDLLGGGIGVWLFDEAEEGVLADLELKKQVISTDACACQKVISQVVSTASSQWLFWNQFEGQAQRDILVGGELE
jgi:hypothetical protein